MRGVLVFSIYIPLLHVVLRFAMILDNVAFTHDIILLLSFTHQIGISCCFYPCEILLSHIPIPARGKDKKEQLHLGRKLAICDVIVMLK